ncbi:replication initiator protein A [Pseudomaricurvus sp.]|uniref:replication initiator protein A n=1 Tax=Pseudomaricurvus sp. TaxID=2004510 RepID=UPI003F6D35B5
MSTRAPTQSTTQELLSLEESSAPPAMTSTTVLPATDQLDLFVADIIDVAPKSDISSMEYPIFAISSKPDREKFRYENEQTGNWLEVIPSADGRATIHDKDLLIYSFGQIAEAANRGRPTSRRVKITAFDYLMTTKRGTDGKSYKAIGDTLARLRGTVFRTNINDSPGSRKSKGEVFGLIDYGAAVTDKNGRLEYFEVVISEQLYNAVANNQILTYNREYFGLRSPYDRRLYEICRKHCGNQPMWDIGLEKLWRKFGVKSPLREFRRKIKDVIKKQSVPDYFLQHESAKESGTIEKLIVMKDLDGSLRASVRDGNAP